ncbi:CTP:molybdopterin cytidylyltransferase MocA [Friedmanniella antarctica]|uniref:CTP:molybdopterin cytidylyltransferase MocA n=1 Tax=Microlunatus antarcticus TaxID=53388 RepID=A0A7W5JWI9_9ACTN|nr:CTP:molybdopterin cytidylyltransferase MocA [Microlunatus antarcticus]
MAWVRRAADVLTDGGCDRVLVVVGAAGDEVAALLDPGTTVVPCPDWADGMSASLRTGLRATSADAVVVHLVDLPDVGAAVVRRLLEQGGRGRDALARAAYGGRPGHPVLVGADHVEPLLASLGGDRGGRAYLDRHGVRAVECGDLATGRDDDGPTSATTP